jgi:hypothetical protein
VAGHEVLLALIADSGDCFTNSCRRFILQRLKEFLAYPQTKTTSTRTHIAAADDVRDVPERPKKMHATAAAEPTNRDNKINKSIKLKPSNYLKTPSDSSSQVDSALPPHKSRLETITSPLTDSLLSSCVHLINNASKLLLLLCTI